MSLTAPAGSSQHREMRLRFQAVLRRTTRLLDEILPVIIAVAAMSAYVRLDEE
ncbi:hypothetical protein [Actinomyces israelii]|uniref:hypothetical protein n=1 Tax=Actinomyces israelii TaxID=1659 RepID=UPI000B046E76|nr:hypothetical protein [Actinomyces israelii]